MSVHSLQTQQFTLNCSTLIELQSAVDTKDGLLEEMSNLTVQAKKDLELARCELDEKQLLLEELATSSNEKIKEAAKTNRDLKVKVEFLQQLSSNLDEENMKLQLANRELETQKAHYKKIKAKLKTDLENLVIREQQLEVQRSRLAYEVEQKTKDLARATKMATVGQLSSALAHDLRNPLTIIKSTVELLKLENTNLDEDSLKKLSRIETAIKKISYQISDVLDFVRESALHLTRVPIKDVIESAINTVPIPQGVKIKKEFRNVIINCDSRKLEAVFTNLITNAIQAMKENGEIRIKVSDNGDDMQVKIYDSGPVILKSTMAKMFEPLFTTRNSGTGLGLAICKRIVEQHGGKISVSSPPTVFTIDLPKSLRGYYKATNSKLS